MTNAIVQLGRAEVAGLNLNTRFHMLKPTPLKRVLGGLVLLALLAAILNEFLRLGLFGTYARPALAVTTFVALVYFTRVLRKSA